MTPEEEKELERICESYTGEAIDFNTDLEDRLKQYISQLLQQRDAEIKTHKLAIECIKESHFQETKQRDKELIEKLKNYKPHRIGIHSDDWGGSSDEPCYCEITSLLKNK